MTNIDKEVERIEQGDTWDETDAVVHVKVKKPLDKVIFPSVSRRTGWNRSGRRREN